MDFTFDRIDQRILLLRPTSLRRWLSSRPNITHNIKWQNGFGDYFQSVPESAKVTYDNWSEIQKNELQEKFDSIWINYHKPKLSASIKYKYTWSGTSLELDSSAVYPPINRAPIMETAFGPYVLVDKEWAWQMYLNFIAFQLFVEIKRIVPWSITTMSNDLLEALFDSSTIFLKRSRTSEQYYVATSVPADPSFVERKQNLGSSIIAPAIYTFRFLRTNNLIGDSILTTISNVLNWGVENLTHFRGSSTYTNNYAIWQYNGLPPITKIIEGTTDTNLHSFDHWTLGCHGTMGFFKNVLRIINIPVFIQIIGEHSTGCFPTENLFLDHGDNIHGVRDGIREGRFSPTDLLVSEATFNSWFGTSRNNSNVRSENIGRKVRELTGR